MTELRSTPIVFGEAVWNPVTRRLTIRGELVSLPHRAAICLDLLVSAGGQPVSREALLDAAWSGAVVEDSNLSHCVLAIRKALDPAPDGGSYIDTVPRIGYRLAVPVEPGAATPPTSAPAESTPVPTSPSHRQWRLWAVGLAAVLLVVTVLWGGSSDADATTRAEASVREGLRLLRRNNAADGAAATVLIEQGLAAAPRSALARAAMAEASARLGNESFDLALRLAREAADADPQCVECRAILGWIVMTRLWDWQESGQLLQGAVASDPTSSYARQWFSQWLTVQGRFTEARAEADAAARLDPANAAAHGQLAAVALFDGRYADAERHALQATQLNPNLHTAHYWRFRALMLDRRDVEAARARAEAVASWGAFSLEARHKLSDGYLKILGEGGARALADHLLAEVSEGRPREVNLYDRAVWQIWAGRPDDALAELEDAVRARPFNVIFTAVDPAFASLRGTARFQRVVAELGLAP